MVGFWFKRAAVVIVLMMHFMLWPQSVGDTDVLAAEPSVQAELQAQPQSLSRVSTKPSVEVPPQHLPSLNPQAAIQETIQETIKPQESQARIDSHAIFTSLASGDRTGGLKELTDYAAPSQPTVYLTFDDGPTKLTPEVLDILKQYNVKATFFVLGQLAENQEDIIRRIHEEGHAIGNHTYNHKYDELYSDFSSFWKQVKQTDDILKQIIGEKVSILRAPGGTATNFDAFYFYYLDRAGYKIHDWTVDSGDSKRRGVPASEIIRNVKKAKLTHEVNLLMHDGAGHRETVKALPEIIEYYRDQGYRFAVIDEQVKPVMFQVRDVKWKRTVDEQQYNRMIAAILEPDIMPENNLLINDQVHILTAQTSAPIPEWIGLREWAIGRGNVSWDPVVEKATMELGNMKVEIHVATGEVMRYQASDVPVPLHVQYKLENGRIYLLQSDLEQLGSYPRNVASVSAEHINT